MGHWLIAHLHIVLAYGYEVLGGILIFYSSAVTEASMPQDRKRVAHWIMFAAIALVYAVFGIGLRHDEVRRGATDRLQAEEDRQHAKEDRQALRDMRTAMDARMDGIFSSFQATYMQLASLSSDLHNMQVGLMRTIHKNDPRQIADLEHQAQAAQQQVDKLSHEVLAITMAPQIARQLREWGQDLKYKKHDLFGGEQAEETRFRAQHPNDAEGLKRLNATWADENRELDRYYDDRLKEIITTADFTRREMLQQIPPQQQSAEDKKKEKEFDQAVSNPESLNRENAAQYLEDLARRVPPPNRPFR